MPLAVVALVLAHPAAPPARTHHPRKVDPATAPTVTSVSPAAGPTGGGTPVTISGTGFTSVTAVKFGTTAAASYSVGSSTEITATSPSHSSGTYDVKVTASGGTSGTSSSDEFTFDLHPTVTGVSPSSSASAAGGTSVTVTGTNFLSGATVSFGSSPATNVTVDSSTEVTCTSPTGTGTVDVTVTTPGGTSSTGSADEFTYGDPLAFIANYGSGTVSVLDTTTSSVTATITLPSGAEPVSVALSPDGEELYVADAGNEDVEVYSTGTNDLAETVSTDLARPDALAVSPTGTYLYVGDATGKLLAFALDDDVPATSPSWTDSDTQLANLSGPLAISFPPGAGSSTDGLVAEAGGNGLGLFAQSSGSASLVGDPTGDLAEPDGIGFTPSGGTAFVTDAGDGSIAEVSLSTDAVTGTVPVTSGNVSSPAAIACGADNCYVAMAGTDEIGIVKEITTTPELSQQISSADFDAPVALVDPPTHSVIDVVCEASGTVAVMNTSTHDITATVTVGTGPVAITVQEG
jgi:YVTN family beta-propeller protein